MKQYDTGLSGEAQAESYLTRMGMLCLARRYRAQDGEIDLIMQEDDTLVMVEVKYRPTSLRGAGVQAVTLAKQRRMAHAALAYLLDMNLQDRSVRFDVVEITRDGVLHIPNAFAPGSL